VADRVKFRQLDVVVDGLPEKYDIITTFDVLHDMINPRGALRAIVRLYNQMERILCWK
jgi:2-polyprenyl-3-methyl-5-hydroxy-6-metoxy-1,4-benzoquinol methylase